MAGRVLVVDDEVLVAMMLSDMLDELGCEVVGPALDIESALALVGGEPFDWAVLDLNIQGKPSFPVARALNARRIPFVFASGYGAADSGSGFEDVPVIQKPFDLAELASVVRRLAPAASG